MLKVSDLYLIKKETIVISCFEIGMLIAYWGSLNPWFLWPIGSLYIVPAAFFVLIAMFVSSTMYENIFSRTDYLLPLTAYIILGYYLLFVNSGNINAFIGSFFQIVVFMSLFMVDKQILFTLTSFLSKAMACLLIVSIPFYLLYLLGFTFPSTNAQYGDGLYTYTNFYFFLLDDRSISIFPRFHSVFLEPGHLGTATVLLLFAQCGYWRKWYNVILWIATLMTFSLAAYVLSVVVIFLNLWMRGKNIFKKALFVICCVAGTVIGSFFYNDGENLIHDLIVIRLEIDEEGGLSGDNRVAGWFEDEYDSYLQSSDVFFGRDYDYSIPGNSGYRLYIYENGLIGLFLVILLYLTFLIKAIDKRVLWSVALIAVLCFWVRGYLLWYSVFIPLFALTNRSVLSDSNKEGEVEK